MEATEAENIEEYIGLLTIACLAAFLYNPGLPAQDATVHSGLTIPTLIINQQNTPKTSTQINLMEDISEQKFALSGEFIFGQGDKN